MTQAKSQVWASNIIQALTDSANSAFRLSDAIVMGSLNLKHLVIKRAVEMVRCEFLEEVDLASSEFQQAVDFTDSVFNKKFISGELRTVFKKDLTFKGAWFKAGASFVGLSCEGTANFRQAVFGEETDAPNKHGDRLAVFDTADFGTALDCEESTFWIGASFKGIQSKGYGSFRKAKFRNQEAEVSFEFASFATEFSCKHAEFHGAAKFEGLKCGGHGSFECTRFENKVAKVSFRAAAFGGTLNCRAAQFQGPVNFNGLECRYGSFETAQFENKDSAADFTYASFAIGIDCDWAWFGGSAIFNSLQCGGAAHFKATMFRHTTTEASFRFSSVARAMNFQNSRFLGPVDFTGMKCNGAADFANSRFKSTRRADFGFSSFGLSLDLANAIFNGETSLVLAKVSSTLNLTGTKFLKLVEFNKAELGALKMNTSKTFSNNGADFRDCKITVFDLPKNEWKDILACQGSPRFSRDPYLQLESYYKKIGSEYAARKVYYAGRNALRKEAWKDGNDVQWSPGNWANDTILKWLTGYGVQTWRLFILVGLLLGVAIAIFSSPYSLKSKPPATAAAVTNESGTAPQQASQITSTPATQLERFVYAVDLFIPVIKLDVADQWQPVPQWRKIYSIVHKVLGWLLIPLLVASIAGILKRDGA